MAKKSVLLLILYLGLSLSLFAETVVLKSGKKVDGKIVERTDTYIKIDFYGVLLTYYMEDIESINGAMPSKKKKETPSPQKTGIDASSSGIDIEHIHKLLKQLGYPENTWPDIERELAIFFSKIDFSLLKQEATQVKSNPERLKQFVSKIGELIEQEGCLNGQSPHPLIRLLVSGLGTEDIFQVIETSPMSQQAKEGLRKDLVSCSAISQLGSILLQSLDISVKAVLAHNHVFNCIPLDDQRVLFVDFTNQVFEIVDLNQFYKLEGKYQVLKEEYHINPERVSAILEQVQRGVRPDTLKELLSLIYFYIYITDDYVVTPAIYNNRGNVYNKQGNFSQAISDCTKAIEIDPNDADAYNIRGVVYGKQGIFPQAISDFTKAIGVNPNFAEAYCNRGNAYNDQGNFSQAISDCTKAIEIDPNYAEASHNRAVAYLNQGDYTKAWEDVHKAESLGAEVNPKFLEELKKASGRER